MKCNGTQFVAAGSWLRAENDHIPGGVYDKRDLQDKHEVAETSMVPDTPVQFPVDCSHDLPQVCQPQGQALVGSCSHANCTNSPPQIATKTDASPAATTGPSLNSDPTNQPISVGPKLPQAHSPPHPQKTFIHPPHHDTKTFGSMGPVLPFEQGLPHANVSTSPSPVSQPSPHPSSPPKDSPKPLNTTASPTKITDSLTCSDTTHTPNLTLKRKIPKDELSTFTKRLRKTENSIEPTFFDPITSTLIPQSEIESFILEEENKVHSPFSPKVHGKPLKGKARNLYSSNSAAYHVSVVDSHILSVHLAEEAALSMPPPPP